MLAIINTVHCLGEWARRQYARTDADWVRTFVSAYKLAPLSWREALRHL